MGCSIAAPMRHLTLGAILLALVAPAVAGSKPCGDDVDGQGTLVPCDCGDVLVSSRTLDARDPITNHPCSGTGLMVDVPPGRPAPTLGLGGNSVAGSGHGMGIHVLAGGDDGLALLGPGKVQGFDIGVFATGALARATEVAATDNATDGFRVGGGGYSIAGCDATHNGRDGFALRGSGFHVEANAASGNGRYGFSVSGHDAAIGGATGNQATGNGRDGIAARGRFVDLTRAIANENGGRGVRAHISDGTIVGAVAQGNARAGVHGGGHDLAVVDSEASDNGGSGIDVRGAHDGGGNSAHGNARVRQVAGGTTECRVGAPCR